MINHKVVRPLVAVTFGLIVALYAYQRINDPEPGRQRAIEVGVVMSGRDILRSYVAPGGDIDVVDPLLPNSKVGKVFISPTADGWELAGHYRRDEADPWHPYLMTLDGEAALTSLAVRDGSTRLLGMSAQDPRFSAVPP